MFEVSDGHIIIKFEQLLITTCSITDNVCGSNYRKFKSTGREGLTFYGKGLNCPVVSCILAS